MNIEAQYQAALDLTHQMLESARTQDWDALTLAGDRRAALVQQAASYRGALSAPEKSRIAAIIVEIERESAEIIERAECWREHVKILLRIDKPSSA